MIVGRPVYQQLTMYPEPLYEYACFTTKRVSVQCHMCQENVQLAKINTHTCEQNDPLRLLTKHSNLPANKSMRKVWSTLLHLLAPPKEYQQ